jgi:uncharacterized membrane protein
MDFTYAFMALLATILSLFPLMIKKEIKFPWLVEFLIVLTISLHVAGEFFRLFYKYAFYSSMMHFLGTATIALIAFIIIYALNLTKQVKLSNLMIGIFTVFCAIALGTLWEISEFASDRILGTVLQGDTRDPLTDTMLDLVWDIIAGIFVAAIGASLLEGYHQLVHPFEEWIKKRKLTKNEKNSSRTRKQTRKNNAHR